MFSNFLLFNIPAAILDSDGFKVTCVYCMLIYSNEGIGPFSSEHSALALNCTTFNLTRLYIPIFIIISSS